MFMLRWGLPNLIDSSVFCSGDVADQIRQDADRYRQQGKANASPNKAK